MQGPLTPQSLNFALHLRSSHNNLSCLRTKNARQQSARTFLNHVHYLGDLQLGKDQAISFEISRLLS